VVCLVPHRPRNPTGFVRQHPDTKRTRWQGIVKYPDPDQPGRWRTRSQTFDRKADAQRWVDETLAEHRRTPEYRPPSDERFGAFLERWLRDVAPGRVYDTTAAAYWRYAKPLLAAPVAQKPLRAVTPADLQAVYAAMVKAGRAPTTVGHTHTVARQALETAVAWGLIPYSPADRVHVPKRRQRAITPPTPAEAQAIVRAADGHRLKALWWLLALTGMRRGEALGLRWEDIDEARRVLMVRRAVTSDGSLRSIHEPKTAAGRRAVAVSDYLLDILREHRQRQRLERLAAGPAWEPSGYVFTNTKGGLLWPNGVWRAFKAVLAKAGLPASIRIHDLRHAMATYWLANGVPVKVVSERLGHANIAITLQIYAHALPTMQAEAAQEMDAWFVAGVTTASPGAQKSQESSES